MVALAAPVDVVARLGRPLTTEEQDRVPGLLDEASASASAWMKCVPDPVPAEVRLVVSRMVARMLKAAESGAEQDLGTSQMNTGMGPFTIGRTFSGDTTSGSPWLNRDDKRILRRFGCRGRVENVGTSRW